MLDRYGLIRLRTYKEAEDYCNWLPERAGAKVCPVSWCGHTMFSVTVLRTYIKENN